LSAIGLVALSLLTAARLVVAEGDTAASECEIQGIAEYEIENVQDGACSEAVYIRACREFCGALHQLGTRRACVGSSSPVAELFHPARHCDEVQHEHFEVSCRVRAECACNADAVQEGS
jgi:hypothetical protein